MGCSQHSNTESDASTNISTDTEPAYYYMLDIDLYVFRNEGGSRDTDDPDGRFNRYADNYTMGGLSIADFVIESLMGTEESSVNSLIEQMDVSFTNGKIRLFYVKTDLEKLNLSTLKDTPSFTLTDETGTENKGTVFQGNGPLRVYLINSATDSAGWAGLGTLGNRGVIIASKFHAGHNTGMNISSLSSTLIHELGHNFGLRHVFADYPNNDQPNPYSCDGHPRGTTDRIMDYTSIGTRPTTFSPCEIEIAVDRIKYFGFNEKKLYNPNETDITLWTRSSVKINKPDVTKYTGSWDGKITIGSAETVLINNNNDVIVE